MYIRGLCCFIIMVAGIQVFAQEQLSPNEGDLDRIQINDLKVISASLLESSDVRDCAWGAYLVGKYQLKEHIPLLLQLLDRHLQNISMESVSLHLVLLDSLIQLEAKLPKDLLMRIYEIHPDPTLIMMAQRPSEYQQDLLSLFKDPTPIVEWLCAGNLLAEVKTAGFAGSLIRELTIKVTIAVSDDGLRGSGEGSGGACGDGFFQAPAGFPPVARYDLTDQAESGSVVVAVGPHTIYYTRLLAGDANPRFVGGSCRGSDERDRYRVEYLAAMLGTTVTSLNLNPRSERLLEWKNRDEYLSDLTKLRQEVESSFMQVIHRLAQRHLLSSTEVSFEPAIEYMVIDLRRNQSAPLPELK